MTDALADLQRRIDELQGRRCLVGRGCGSGSTATSTARYLGGGVWEARCRYRDSDGVVRKVQRLGPADEFDKHGKLAEDALIEALAERRATLGRQISLDTLLLSLVISIWTGWPKTAGPPQPWHIQIRGAASWRSSSAGCGSAKRSTARLDAALRSMRDAHGATMAKQVQDDLARCATARGDGQRAWRQPGARCAADQVQGPAEGRAGADRRPITRPVGEAAGVRRTAASTISSTRSPC